MAESTITTTGRTTIPADIRRATDITPGTRLVWHALNDGRLFVRVKSKSVLDLKGMLKPPQGKHVAIRDLKA
ncbi:MAG: AbrB/MazE/SpoVT family DNA-binding domain-containing protein [Burkholderiaceae bacterium]|nr:MAG: AbrB/MazE/SpoVT family DNA-binding domain-containing protein [Burkholderiaceae bacterium]